MINHLLLIIGSYLLGAIPFGLVIARAMGAGDIRKMGSGNIGATNVLRTTGKIGGIITLLFDAIKGLIPVLIAKSWWGIDSWTLLVALAAILGHNYPIYLKFKGGKGVATSLGIIIALWPYIGLAVIGIWLTSVIIWRYSSLAALISFGLLPILISLSERNIQFFYFSVLISVMIFYRHIENIKRLLAGKEKKAGKGESSTLTLLIFTLLLINSSSAYAAGAGHTSTIPFEMQKIWDERQIAISKGDNITGEAKLNGIIEMKYKLGINRIDEISALLVREGYQSLEKGMNEEAYNLSNIAKEISPKYAPPYFLSAMSLLKKSKVMEAISEYLRGLKVSLEDFWTIFNILGRLYLIIFIALSLTSLTFLLVWLLRELPIFSHTFREITSGLIDKPLRPVFFSAVIILPLVFGIGWFILAGIAGLWILLSRKERIIGILIVVFFLLLPQTIKYYAVYIDRQDNLTLQGLLAVKMGYGDKELIYRLKDEHKKEPDNVYLTFSIAYLLYKQGNTEEALNYYNKLTDNSQGNISVGALNNIGNIYFKDGKYDNAILYYKKAIDKSTDSPIPLYNISQAYREKLSFEDAENAYESAKKIYPEEVGVYATLASKGKGFKIIDFPVSRRDIWTVALRPAEDSKMFAKRILRCIIKTPPDRFHFLGFSIFIILALLSYLKPRTPMAYHCPRCANIVCGWCTGSRIFGNTCMNCRRKNDMIAGSKDIDRRISFILPGIWHIYKGFTGFGGAICFVFFAGLSGLILAGTDNTWFMAYNLYNWSVILWSVLILLSYLILPLHFKYITIRFNS